MSEPIPFRARYDVVVVGARCAGAATAMLLARRGARVLVVDRSSYGADALSTHALMRAGVLQLHRWRLLDKVIAGDTPPVRTTIFRYGDREVVVPIRPKNGVDALYAPRRTLLDRVLVDAAREAGADVRHRVDVVDLGRRGERVTGVKLVDRDGQLVDVEADLVVGADGVRSRVAARVGAPAYRTCRHSTAIAYGYFSGVDATEYTWLYRPGVAGGVIPTNGGESCIFVAIPPRELFEWSRRDLVRGFSRAIETLSPALSRTLSSAKQCGALRSFGGTAGFLRQSHGPGWALVGDAGYFKDPLTAHGMTDAMRDAELLARAILRGGEALADYQRQRDDLSLDMLERSDEVASFAWDLDELARLHEAINLTAKREIAAIEAFDAGATVAA